MGRRVRPAALPADLPADPTERAEVLAGVVERQAALLQREDEVHRVLVRIVLGGGSLAELCEAVAGFFGGAAVVTTTDGRVLAMAGGEGQVERARALDCFDRTGRLVVENEPVGPRERRGPTSRPGPSSRSWPAPPTTGCSAPSRPSAR